MTEPFLKWAGGKRWLVQRYAHLLPESSGRYVEPFLGGGALFFHLTPADALLADRNAELIGSYRALRDDPIAIRDLLQEHQEQHSADYYYRVREALPGDRLGRAARFIYLNRVCFNGLYRVNRAGVFNVPIGSKQLVEFNLPYLQEVAKVLRRVSLHVADFERTIGQAKRGDFLYLDPPYTVAHNTNNFVKYNAPLFSWDDQVRLAKVARKAARRGVMVMISNADHATIRALYEKDWKVIKVDRFSRIAGDAGQRRGTSELLIRNFSNAS